MGAGEPVTDIKDGLEIAGAARAYEQVQVVIADVAEHQVDRIRQRLLQFPVELVQEVGHCGDVHAHVEAGVGQQVGGNFSNAVADAPERLPVLFRLRDRRVVNQLVFQRVGEYFFESPAVGFLVRALRFHQCVNWVLLIKG